MNQAEGCMTCNRVLCEGQEQPQQLMSSPGLLQRRPSPSPSSRSSQQLPEWICDLNKPLSHQRRCDAFMTHGAR